MQYGDQYVDPNQPPMGYGAPMGYVNPNQASMGYGAPNQVPTGYVDPNQGYVNQGFVQPVPQPTYQPVQQQPYQQLPQQPQFQPVSQPVAYNQGVPYSQGVPPQSSTAMIAPPVTQVQYVFVNDPLQELASSASVLVKQQPDFVEQFTRCDNPNIYDVFVQTPMGVKYLFKCLEISNCCARKCCSPQDRGLTMEIQHITNQSNILATGNPPYIKIQKPCSCCGQAVMKVALVDGSQIFGNIRQPCCSCGPELDIYDENDELKYTVETGCCEIGCMGKICQKTNNIQFTINQGGHDTGGRVTKIACDVNELLTEADSYQVVFPQDANPADKILFIVATLMIDYQYFEDELEDDDDVSGGGYIFGGGSSNSGYRRRRKKNNISSFRGGGRSIGSSSAGGRSKSKSSGGGHVAHKTIKKAGNAKKRH